MRERKALIVDGVSSLDYGIWIDSSDSYASAAPDVTKVSVPGSNGDLIINNNRFHNVSVSYKCFLTKQFMEKFIEYKAFLLSDVGYRTIRNNRNITYYRYGRIDGEIRPEDIIWNNDQGTFTVKFDCKPQLFITGPADGEPLVLPSAFLNPYPFTAKPIIRVSGASGQLTLSNGLGVKTLEWNNPYYPTIPYINVDTEVLVASYGTYNLNYCINRADFYLTPGANEFSAPAGTDTQRIFKRFFII